MSPPSPWWTTACAGSRARAGDVARQARHGSCHPNRAMPGHRTAAETPGMTATTAKPRPAPGAVEHPSRAERLARGKAARAEVPRSAHAGWTPPSVRRDPVAVLEEQARSRVAELVPIRHGRMLLS